MKYIIAIFCLFLVAPLGVASELDEAREAFQRKDYAAAIHLLTPLAERGDADATANLGDMYGFGRGVPQDEVRAMQLWRRAAKQHVPSAFGNIASCYMVGKCGVPVDQPEAFRWYVLASEHRHALSMITLSGMYDLGIATQADKLRALAWAGLALANAPSEKIRQMARAQLGQAAEGASEADIKAAQVISNGLLKTINDNVRKYKTGT